MDVIVESSYKVEKTIYSDDCTFDIGCTVDIGCVDIGCIVDND